MDVIEVKKLFQTTNEYYKTVMTQYGLFINEELYGMVTLDTNKISIEEYDYKVEFWDGISNIIKGICSTDNNAMNLMNIKSVIDILKENSDKANQFFVVNELISGNSAGEGLTILALFEHLLKNIPHLNKKA